MTNSVDSLLSEVDADVRAERVAALWKRYRTHLLIALALVIGGTIAANLWQHEVERRGGERLLQLVNARDLLTQGKAAEAASAFGAVAETASGETRTLAQLWQARALATADKKPEAIAVLTTAVANKSGLWSDIACLRLASLDTNAPDCLADKTDTPLVLERREWVAAQLWASGKRTDAIALIEALSTDSDTPEEARGRIREWLATLRAERASE